MLANMFVMCCEIVFYVNADAGKLIQMIYFSYL